MATSTSHISSSGRLPSEKGRLYIDELQPAALTKPRTRPARRAAVGPKARAALGLRPSLWPSGRGAPSSQPAQTDAYYTGLSPLFNQPEFRLESVMVDGREVLDRLDDVLAASAPAPSRSRRCWWAAGMPLRQPLWRGVHGCSRWRNRLCAGADADAVCPASAFSGPP